MDKMVFEISRAVASLQKAFPRLTTDFEDLKVGDKQLLLHKVAVLLLNENCTLKVSELFSPLLLDLLSRCRSFSKDDIARHEALCVALANLIWLFPDVAKFTYDHFSNHAKSIFVRYKYALKDEEKDEDEGSPQKKMKREKDKKQVTPLLIAALQFLAFDVEYFRDIWDWSVIVPFVEKGEDIAWLTHQCLARVCGMSLTKLNSILEDTYLDTENHGLHARYGDLLKHLSAYDVFNQGVCLRSESRCENMMDINDGDLVSEVVNIKGTLLPVIPRLQSSTMKENIVAVDSVQKLIQQLGMAVSSGAPVLLQGPVGCGKTSLVEYLAELTNRNDPKHLLRVQMCDQIDSKFLLGSYCCTEIPGEFVWQPGILTRAVVDGHWLIMEDIDSAPMDVISILAPILELQSLVLPGHANPIKVHPTFQLFATQRILPGYQGSYLEHRSSTNYLNKFWRKITIIDFQSKELKHVICSRWPKLQPIVGTILAVYFTFKNDLIKEKDAFKDLPVLHFSFLQHGRLMSTRDLFKFCKRIEEEFKNCMTHEQALTMLKHALDCFVHSLQAVEIQKQAAIVIGEQFNVSSVATLDLFLTYKPDIHQYDNRIEIGRGKLPIKDDGSPNFFRSTKSLFAYTRQSLTLLEKVTVAVADREPVLLVGETGTGKTSVIQFLAKTTNNNLCIINMSQHSDSTDLLGGFKPVAMKIILKPVRDEFERLFSLTYEESQNNKFLGHIQNCFQSRRWDLLFGLMRHVQGAAMSLLRNIVPSSEATNSLLMRWHQHQKRVEKLALQIQQSSSLLAFTFVEGALIKAMKSGDWILLDEINLAEADTLQCLAAVLEDHDSMLLLEKGDTEPVKRHPDFRIFACMNPATDVGKKDLPVSLRNRFTEFYVEEVQDKNDLMVLVETYLKNLALDTNIIASIVDFYLFIQKEAVKRLNDGTGHPPHYSLRTLCRALSYASLNSCGIVFRSLYEGFALSFLSQLDRDSYCIVEKIIQKYILGENRLSILKQKIPEPSNIPCMPVEGYYIPVGGLQPCINGNYIIVNTIQKNLQRLARAVSAGKYPILLQGETSVGKTSLIQWLAMATGHYCVRINNHEHTDIQEYIGSYASNSQGKLVFIEGILVQAMQKGWWIILDELNLAPTEVLEAMNRVLDDNRELFITETQKLVKAHEQFLVFATQNPPGQYGGRKVLSRAFRNRFIEIYFDEIPTTDLETILTKRCKLAPSHSKKMVAVMQDLRLRRRESGIFAGKQGYITLRDLFRWGDRNVSAVSGHLLMEANQRIAEQGYLLLADRVRRKEEAAVIQHVLEKHTKAKIDWARLYPIAELQWKQLLENYPNFHHIVYTSHIRRIFALIGKALDAKEPVLLVGDTGCGKTTMCQIFAEISGCQLYSVNCHLNSESSDFLGNLRPVRCPDESECLFEWVDGPLVQAMKTGDYFLADEISLADDSVLERLNSLLEPDRTIQLTERFGNKNTEIVADDKFRFLATMNPGGDYGKKELSPALRNRFTEIWCPSDLIIDELSQIVDHNISHSVSFSSSDKDSGFGYALSQFLNFFLDTAKVCKLVTISIRDISTWVDFINATVSKNSMDLEGSCESRLTAEQAYIHGACLVFLDSLGTSSTANLTAERIQEIKQMSFKFMINCAKEITGKDMNYLEEEVKSQWNNYQISKSPESSVFGIGPFVVRKSRNCSANMDGYTLHAPTVKTNAVRVLRAMQLSKPILLEGSPGVGKTSLVTALAKASGHKVVRINLSEQTDITDLYGMDLPVENGECGEFGWRDGPFLQAVKDGHWILLDELNLATQSVLEGLNACLDHRGEIYISELNMSFVVSKKSRIFACQNPQKQGGSRKGLPRSFLNRFTQVYMVPMTEEDLNCIALDVYPQIPPLVISNIIRFNEDINDEFNKPGFSRHPGYEFNLRDIFRWCDLMVHDQGDDFTPGIYVQLLYADRMRTNEDKENVLDLCYSVFRARQKKFLQLHTFSNYLQVGYSFIPRVGSSSQKGQLFLPMHSQLPVLESLMKCIEMNWMPILIGPPASGKTALVHFLASLSGQTLKVLSMNSEMDTTELLGGYEQANLNRHIDYVLQDLEPIVKDALFSCLKAANEQSYEQLAQILKTMHVLKEIQCHTSCLTAADEVNICRQHVRRLKKIVSLLDSVTLSEDISSCFQMVKKKLVGVYDKLKTDVVASGGRFEWVDSVLVQAVEKGFWLLVENVNFCSPSVLDRLNSLLESNGKLLLAEQGITENGFTEIKPHPNFRIILTMNPQNGEISPAMRNRGVEIALTEELMQIDNEHCSIWDLFGFFHAYHITDRQMILIIRKVFSSLSRSKGIENLSTYDFINAISLTVQSLQKHKNLRKAIATGFDGAIVSNIINKRSHEVAFDVLKNFLGKELIHDVSTEPYQEYLGRMMFSSVELQMDSVYISAKQQCRVLEFMLMYFMDIAFKNDEFSCKSRFQIPPPLLPPPASATSNWIDIFILILRIIFENCSPTQWHIVSIWLKETLFSCISNLRGLSEEGTMVIGMLQFLLEAHFNKLYESKPIKNHITYLREKANIETMLIEVHELPIDIRRNYYVYNKFRVGYNSHNGNGFDKLAEVLNGSANRILLLLKLDAFYVSEYNSMQIEANKEMSNRSSLWSLSEALVKHSNVPVEEDRPLLENLTKFISELQAFLRKTILERSDPYPQDEKFWKVQNGLNTYFEFVRFCGEPFSQIILDKFPQYWSLLMKQLFNRYMTSDEDVKNMEKLNYYRGLIDQYLNGEISTTLQIRSKLRKHWNIPVPINDEKSARVYIDSILISQAIDIHKIICSSSKCSSDIQLIFTNASKWIRDLRTAARCIFQNQSEELNDVHTIKLQLTDAKILELSDCVDDDDDEIMEICQEPAHTQAIEPNKLKAIIQLLPLRDYFLIHTEFEALALIAKQLSKGQLFMNEDSYALQKCKSLMYYLGKAEEHKLILDPFHCATLDYVCSRENKVKLSEYLIYFFQHLRNGPSAYLIPYLTWDENVHTQAIPMADCGKPFSALLSCICFNMLSGTKSTDNAPSIKDISWKKDQIGNMLKLLWQKHRDVSKRGDFFRNGLGEIVNYWYQSLIASLCKAAGILPEPNNLFKACDNLKLNSIFELNDFPNIIMECFKNLQVFLRNGEQGLYESFPLTNWDFGKVMALIGLISMILLAPLDIIDPVEKQHVKLAIVQSSMTHYKMEYSFRNWQCESVSGLPITTVSECYHPHLAHLVHEIKCLQGKEEELESKLAFRPEPSQFKDLRNSVYNFFVNVANPAEIYKTINDIGQLLLQIENDFDITTLQLPVESLKTTITNCKKFAQVIYSTFPLYKDLTLPFLTGVEMMIMGFEIMNGFLSSVDTNGYILWKADIEKFIRIMGSFPYLDNTKILTPLQVARYLAEDNISACINFFNKPPDDELHTFSILKSSLLEIVNEAIIFGKNAIPDILNTTMAVLARFHEVWNKQETARKVTEEISESVYKCKTQTYGLKPEDDEVIKQEMGKMFPFYIEEFKEFLAGSDQEDEMVQPLPQSSNDGIMTANDMLLIWRCQIKLLLALSPNSKSDLLNYDVLIKKTDKPDFVSSYNLRYDVLKKPIQNNFGRFNNYVDNYLVGGHIIAASTAFQLSNADNPMHNEKSLQDYDIYYDPNPTEVFLTSLDLESLASQVHQLLVDYPEYPALTQIIAVIERIQSFSINDPLIKYVTGLEVILSIAQVWEQNARKDASLQSKLEIIAARVVRYRNLELRCWNQRLNSIIKKQYLEVAKMWFHLYAIIFVDFRENDEVSIIESLKTFVESASLGQFEPRLLLVQTFFHHLKLSSSASHKKVLNIFFNIYSFYAQYLPAVQNMVASIRKPIEKDIKDYVKISKWNSADFYAMRDAVKKSQRIVHRSIKSFENQLSQPAKSEFQISPNLIDAKETPWSLQTDVKNYFLPLRSLEICKKEHKDSDIGIFQNLPRYFHKSTKICEKIFNQFYVIHYIHVLNKFAGTVAETYQDLESLEIKTKRDSESQKREVRRFLDHKRKSIAKLFKDLSLSGISYRKGQVFLDKLGKNMDAKLFLIPVLEDEQWIEQLPAEQSTSVISSAWRDVNYYYYKCLTQFFLLKSNSSTPCMDIKDMAIVQKCMGFAGHLLKIVISQREVLGNSAEHIQDLNVKSGILLKLSQKTDVQQQLGMSQSSEMYFPPQNLVLIWKAKLSCLLVQTVVAFQQLEVLLNCCPVNNETCTPEAESSVLCLLVKGSAQHEEVLSYTQRCIAVANAIISNMSQMSERKVVDTWENLLILRKCFTNLTELMDNSNPLQASAVNKNAEIDFIPYIFKLRKDIYIESVAFKRDVASKCSLNTASRITMKEKKLAHLSERLLTNVLKSIENVFAFLSEETLDSQSDRLSKLLDIKITQTLEKVRDLLEVPKILDITNRIIRCIRRCTNSSQEISFIEQYVINLSPVLHRYSEITKLMLVGNVAMHRTSCKLLSELLHVFGNLIVKGFSIPLEFQDTAEKIGAVKFTDIEQGGFGEGEGMKDVSDTITSEDQLEEAKGKGTETKSEEKSDIKDEEHGVEMSEDFEGDIFDPDTEEKTDDENDEEFDDSELDKKMGDTGHSGAEKLNDQIWGSDDEEDEDMEEDESGIGVTSNESSELAPKDNKAKMDENKKKEMNRSTPEKIPDPAMDEEYLGEHANPSIDQLSEQEAEVLDLDNDLQIDEEESQDNQEMDVDSIKDDDKDDLDESQGNDDATVKEENVVDLEDPNEIQLESDDEKGTGAENVCDTEPEVEPEKENDEIVAPTRQTASQTKDEILPSERTKHSSLDLVKQHYQDDDDDDDDDDWEGGVQEVDDQHHEGQADMSKSKASEEGHQGKKSTLSKQMTDKVDFEQARHHPSKRRQPRDDRTLGDPALPVLKKVKLSEHQRDGIAEVENADDYEHVVDEHDNDLQAVDSATQEQAAKQPFSFEQGKELDVIPVLSSSEEDDDDGPTLEPLEFQNEASHRKKMGPNQKTEEMEYIDETLDDEDNSLKFVDTQGAQRPPSSVFNTQHDLWSTLSTPDLQQRRENVFEILSNRNTKPAQSQTSDELWHELEFIVAPLVHELCEQLRLILEPTKMSKFKGDYRTGKRLNMRKIIAYLASQFRKDKIWLRRTKPSKREYQVMLAVDDSASMANNQAKELAFESLALLGKSLSLLEVGELSIVSFGENVKLLHEFNNTFSSATAAKILDAFSFDQEKTKIAQLLHYATNKMIEVRKTQSRLISTEVAQLLIIISDGRDIFHEGKEEVWYAIRRARQNNVFMVYIILDNPLAKDSILDILAPQFSAERVLTMKSYMENFPFPFYILLRDIASLPAVLGEAMRQWFELVTSADR